MAIRSKRWQQVFGHIGLLSVVRAGGDADTNAAVACAILGAKYGFSSIPDEYVNGLIYKEQLEEVVNGMIGLAK